MKINKARQALILIILTVSTLMAISSKAEARSTILLSTASINLEQPVDTLRTRLIEIVSESSCFSGRLPERNYYILRFNKDCVFNESSNSLTLQRAPEYQILRFAGLMMKHPKMIVKIQFDKNNTVYHSNIRSVFTAIGVENERIINTYNPTTTATDRSGSLILNW